MSDPTGPTATPIRTHVVDGTLYLHAGDLALSHRMLASRLAEAPDGAQVPVEDVVGMHQFFADSADAADLEVRLDNPGQRHWARYVGVVAAFSLGGFGISVLGSYFLGSLWLSVLLFALVPLFVALSLDARRWHREAMSFLEQARHLAEQPGRPGDE